MARVIKFEGRRITVPDDATDAEIKQIILGGAPDTSAAQLNPQFATAGTEAPELQPADGEKVDIEAAAQHYRQQMDGYKPRGFFPALDALTEGSQAGLMAGFDDEIGAAMMAPFGAAKDWMAGKGFDLGPAYERGQKGGDLRKEQRREAFPGTSIAGELAGGLAAGGKAAQSGLTLFGRAPALMAAPAEGALYGGLYGAGEAKPGERMAGAEGGALTGAAAGLLLHGAGKAAEKMLTRPPATPTAPAAETLADDATKLYTAMENSGITIKPGVTQQLKTKIEQTLSRTEQELAPTAFALKKMADRTLGENASIGNLHNFAKAINQELRGPLKGADKTYVAALKDYVETLIEQGAGIANVPGNKASEAFQMWKQADELWSRYKKTELVDKILEQAEVDGAGRYTQSGVANAIRREMNTVWRSINKGKSKGWTKEEIALIRQMAAGGSTSRLVNLLSKFAPRGVVSGALGYAAGGPGLMLGGYLAGRAADRGATAAATSLRDAAARGFVPPPVTPSIAPLLHPFIPGVSGASTEAVRSLSNSR